MRKPRNAFERWFKENISDLPLSDQQLFKVRQKLYSDRLQHSMAENQLISREKQLEIEERRVLLFSVAQKTYKSEKLPCRKRKS
jgi:hypothetical protein